MSGALGRRAPQRRDARILVVGAGPAGLSAARYLEREGFERVTVIERAARVGGKCLSRSFDGRVHELGAVLLTPDYRLTLALLDELGLETVPVGECWAVDPLAGERRLLPSLASKAHGPERRARLEEVARGYLRELRSHREHVGRAGYRKLPEELTLPFTEWARRRGLEEMRDVALVPFTTFGYGSLDVISAAYVLKCVSRRSFLSLGNEVTDWPRRVELGYQTLMARIAAELRELRLAAEILQVERDGRGVRVRSRSDGVERLEDFDALVIATPLDGEGSLAYLDLDEGERSLFSQVRYFRYFTSACRVEGLDAGAVQASVLRGDALVEPPDGLPCLFVRHHEESDVAVFYSFAGDRARGVPEVEAGIARCLSTLGARLRSCLETHEWRYFPHVSPEAMRDGFFDRVEDRQGARHTYYTGGQLDFDIVEGAFAYSRHLVDTYFS